MFSNKKESLVSLEDTSEHKYKGMVVHVKAVYTCRLCGTRIMYGNAVDILYDELPSVIGKFVNNQLFVGNPYIHQVPMHLPHMCKDGNAGLAQLSGLVQVSSD